MTSPLNGLYLIEKPAGYTSFSVVQMVSKRIGIKKAGHTGTLDKFAEGLLLILTGKYTKLVPLFEGLSKEYEALIALGVQTDTLDPYGKIIGKGRIPEAWEIEETVSHFKGEIEQIPPVFSAVHVGGIRAYKQARKGEDVRLKPRKVVIHDMEILGYENGKLHLRVQCSKGTYIRALARDIANKMETFAYVEKLKRLKIGNFNLRDAEKLENIKENTKPIEPFDFLRQLNGVEYLNIDDIEILEKLRDGINLTSILNCNELENDRVYAIFNESRELVAIFEKKDGHCRYLNVFAR